MEPALPALLLRFPINTEHVYVLPGQPDILSNCDNNVVIATDGPWRFAGAIELEAWELAGAELLLDANTAEEDWTVLKA